MANYLYLRVSTKNQSTGRQQFVLDKKQLPTIDIEFQETASAKDTTRKEFQKLLAIVKEGDNIYCESISRFSRNVDDLRQQCEALLEKGVIVHFVKEGFNTGGDNYKFMLTILGAVAEMEREITNERVRQGVARCMETRETKTGNWFGQPKKTAKTLPKNFKQVYELMQKEGKDGVTKVMGAKMLGVSRRTLYRYIDIYKASL